MKYFSFILFCFSIWCCKKEKQIPEQIKNDIQATKLKYAPDKRVRIFNITPIYSNNKLILRGETSMPEAKIELLQKLDAHSFIDSIEILPSKELGSEQFGIITIPVANMRSNPGHSSELSNQVLCGTVLRLYKLKGSWVYCQTPDDYLGWIDAEAIFGCDSIKLADWYAAPKSIITQDQTYVLESPIQGADIISPLSIGAILKSENYNNEYLKMTFPDGRSGYIPNHHAQNLIEWKVNHGKGLTADVIIKNAHSFLGRPYLWGGTSGNGMDCSGFTKTVFFNNGFLLPRDASQQVHVGLPVDTDTTFNSLQSGDLLFFGRKATAEAPEKITHVAIYLGDGKIIHASGYVRVQSIRRGDPDFEESRLTSFVRATRPISAPKEHGILAVNDVKWYQ